MAPSDLAGDSAAPLRLYAREFDGFERALLRQAKAWGGLPVELHMLEISELEHRLIGGDLAQSGDADIVLVNTDWLPYCMSNDLLTPIDAYLADSPPEGWPDAWSPSLQGLQKDTLGRVFGLPYHDGPVLLIYRADLYADPTEQIRFNKLHGRPLLPPTTWAELVVQARYFTRPDEGLYGTILAGLPDTHNNVYDFLTQLWARGGDVLDLEGRSALNSPQAADAAQFLYELWHDEGVINPAAANWDSVQSGVHFAAGEAALMVNWCGFASLAADPTSPTHGRLACAPAPAGPEPLNLKVTMNSYWVLAIPAGSRDKDAAYQFIAHTAGRAMDRITAEEQATAVRRDNWSDPDIQALAPYYAVLDRAHEGARSVPVDSRWPAFAEILNVLMRRIIVDAEDPRDPLRDAHETLEGLLLKQ